MIATDATTEQRTKAVALLGALDASLARTAELFIEDDYTVRECSPNDIFGVAAENDAIVFVIDHRRGEFDGVGVLKRLRTQGFTPRVLFITRDSSIADAVEVMKCGGAFVLSGHVSAASVVEAVKRELHSQS